MENPIDRNTYIVSFAIFFNLLSTLPKASPFRDNLYSRENLKNTSASAAIAVNKLKPGIDAGLDAGEVSVFEVGCSLEVGTSSL
jgi:hypothetical protein